MKKLVSVLLVLTLALSLFTVAAGATEDASPTILKAEIINEKQLKITTSEEVMFLQEGTSGLYFYDGQKLLSNNRYSGNISPLNAYGTTFTWTLTGSTSIEAVFDAAEAAGYSVVYAVNGTNIAEHVKTDRAQDKDGNGFKGNVYMTPSAQIGCMTEVTDYAGPVITSAIAISDKQIKFTTNRPIKVTNQSFALFVGESALQNGTDRFGGDVAPYNEFADEFTWTISSGNATQIITEAQASGNKVYFGINAKHANGVMERAEDEDGNGFLRNLPLNHDTHGLHGVEINAVVPNTIQSVTTIGKSTLEIAFAKPLISFSGVVQLGVLNAEGTDWTTDELGDLATTVAFDEVELTESGTLICTLTSPKAGVDEADAKNLNKIVDAIAAVEHQAGIMILENNNADAGVTKFNSGYLEEVVAEGGIVLAGTTVRTGNKRDARVHAITKGEFGEANLNGTLYETLGEALEAAKAEDTIVLMEDVTLKDMVVLLNTDVTLDLNGHELTVNNYLVPFGGIMDSKDGEGKLVIAKDNIKGNLTDNGYLPLYDEDGYRFFKYEFRHVDNKIADADKVQYSVGLGFENKAAYNFLLDDDVEFGVKMAIEKADGEKQYITWVFSDTLMQKFVEKNATTRTAITLTISGMASLEDGTTVSAKAILTSEEHALNLAEDMVEKQ